MASIVDKFEVAIAAVEGLEETIPLITKFIQDATATLPTLKADGDAILQKIETIFKSL